MAGQNGDVRQRHVNGTLPEIAVADGATIAGRNDAAHTKDEEAKTSSSTLNLIICAGGIYASL